MVEGTRHAWFNGKLVGIVTSSSGTDETIIPYDRSATLFRRTGFLKRSWSMTVVDPNEVDIVKSGRFDNRKSIQPVKIVGKGGDVIGKGWNLETSYLP
jgi:hypothetical protein